MAVIKTVSANGAANARNLWANSEDLSGWSKSNTTVTLNAAANPLTGVVNADLIVEAAITGAHRCSPPSFSVAAGVTYTMSFYAKASGRAGLDIEMWLASDFMRGAFNLATGTCTGTNFSMVDAGGGWYRCVMTGTPAASGSWVATWNLYDGTTSNYTGDGSSGILISDVQLEFGTAATDYEASVPSDFTSLAAWQSYASTQATADQWAACYATGNLGGVSFGAWTATPTDTVHPRIYGANGHRPDASYNKTGAYIDLSGGSIAINDGTVPFLEIDGITIAGPFTSRAIALSTTGTIKNTKLLVTGTGTPPGLVIMADNNGSGTTGTTYIYNNAIYFAPGLGVPPTGVVGAICVRPTSASASGVYAIYNNTVICNGKCQYGLNLDASFKGITAVVQNNLIVGSASADYASNTGTVIRTQTYCMSSDTTSTSFGGAGNVDTVSPDQFEAGSFSLLDTSDAVDAGTNSGATTDMIGSSRPQGSAYDIGAIELLQADVPAGGGVGAILSRSAILCSTFIRRNR